MSGVEILLAVGVVTAGATLQGAVGFGLGLFSVPLLILIDPRLIPGPLITASLALTVLLAHRERRAIEFGDLGWALSGRAVGVVAAGFVLVVVPADRLALVFGALVLVAVGVSASGWHLDPRPRTLLGAGLLSGFMATVVSIGGPPMALLYQRESGARLRGTLAAFYVIGVLFTLVALRVVGRYGWVEVRLAAALVPGMLLGYLLSVRIARRLDRGSLRAAVLAISAVSGVAVIVVHLL